jgi:hypothetical protein
MLRYHKFKVTIALLSGITLILRPYENLNNKKSLFHPIFDALPDQINWGTNQDPKCTTGIGQNSHVWSWNISNSNSGQWKAVSGWLHKVVPGGFY